MLNHRLVTAVFAIGIGLVFIFCELASHGFYLALAVILFAYLTIEFAGAYFIGLNFHLESQNHLDKSTGQVALTFDDGPRRPETLRVLETLRKHDVKATFFVIGKCIEGNEDVLKQIIDEGHSIGSHSFSHHYWIDLWGKNKLKADLLRSAEAIKKATGRDVSIMRPPYGVTTPNFRQALGELGWRSIGWNVRSYDTATTDLNKIFERVMQKTRGGSIILLHDRLSYMPALLDQLIPALKQKKFEFVTIH